MRLIHHPVKAKIYDRLEEVYLDGLDVNEIYRNITRR